MSCFRYNIITEIIQATTIKNLQQEQLGVGASGKSVTDCSVLAYWNVVKTVDHEFVRLGNFHPFIVMGGLYTVGCG